MIVHTNSPDLSDFDPYSSSSASTSTSTGTARTTDNNSSSLLNSRSVLPSRLTTTDPLNSFDLLSFDDDHPIHVDEFEEAVIQVADKRRMSILDDLKREPFGDSHPLPALPDQTLDGGVIREEGRRIESYHLGSTTIGTSRVDLVGSVNSLRSSPLLGSPPRITFADVGVASTSAMAGTNNEWSDFQSVNEEGFESFSPRGSTKSIALPEIDDDQRRVVVGGSGRGEETAKRRGFDISPVPVSTTSPVIASTQTESKTSTTTTIKQQQHITVMQRDKSMSSEKSYDSPRRGMSVDLNLKEIKLVGMLPYVKRVLDEDIAEGIRPHLPPRRRISTNWKLLYSLDQHGTSMTTMYETMWELAGEESGVVLVVRSTRGDVFGAFVNEALRENNVHYGDGSCFLWKATPFPASDPRIGCSIKSYTWTGKNEYYIFTNSKVISVGGGDGKFGLWIDAVFEKGFTSRCPCFGNEPLTQEFAKGVSGNEESAFEVLGFECWAVLS